MYGKFGVTCINTYDTYDVTVYILSTCIELNTIDVSIFKDLSKLVIIICLNYENVISVTPSIV